VSDFTENYYKEVASIAEGIDQGKIGRMVYTLNIVRRNGGRLFILGVGGGAGNASHAVNDFRKICGIEAYAPTDNVSELTARINDDGWNTSYSNWLRASNIRESDAVLVFSVGGGDIKKQVSINIVEALRLAHEAGCWILGIVGRDGGYTAKMADVCVIIPASPENMTAHTEAFQSVVWHGIVNHPTLRKPSNGGKCHTGAPSLRWIS
jgi:D-sedoheptulose 7-phosphate isomerase